MTTPAIVALPEHIRGDLWAGIAGIGPVTVNGVVPANDLASARITFRRSLEASAEGYSLSTAPTAGQGTITLASANEWELVVPPQALPLSWGAWVADLQLVDSAGQVFTYVQFTLNVLADATR